MSTPIRRSIYGKLAGDSTLTALLSPPPTGFSQSIFYQRAPQQAQPPYIIFQKQAGTPVEAFGDPDAFDRDVWLVKGVDRSTTADTVEAIQDRIKALLNDASLSISGATLCDLRRVSDVEYPEQTDGVEYKHAGSLFRLVTT